VRSALVAVTVHVYVSPFALVKLPEFQDGIKITLAE